MAERKKSIAYKALVIVGIMAFSLSLRLYSLNSDAPDYLSWSAAIYVDEGYKALDARNTVKYGRAQWTRHDAYKGHKDTSKFIYGIQMKIFKKFGISILSLRYFNIAVSMGIILCMLLTLAFCFDAIFLLLFGVAMSINVILLFHSRMALYELPMVFTGSLLIPPMIAFMSPAVQKKAVRRVIMGLVILVIGAGTTWVGMGIKESYPIYFLSLIAAFFFAALLPLSLKNRLPRFMGLRGLFNASIVLMIGSSFLLYFWRAVSGSGGGRYLGDPVMLLAKMWFLEFIYLQPNTFILAILGCIAAVKMFEGGRYAHMNREDLFKYQIDLFFAIQFIYSFLAVYMSSYSPLRYFLFSEIAVLYTAARFVANYDAEFKILRSRIKRPRTFWKNILIFLLVFYVVVQFIIFLVMLFISYEKRKIIFDDFYLSLRTGSYESFSVYFIFTLILLIIPLVYYVAKYHEDILLFLKKRVSTKIMIFMLIEVQLIYLLSWQFNMTYTIRQGMDFVDTLPAGRVIIGDWAPMMAFESNLKIIYSSLQDKRNIKNIPRFRPDYIVVNSNRNEEEKYNRIVPGLIKPRNLIYEFSVQAFYIRIYRIDKYRRKARPPAVNPAPVAARGGAPGYS